MCINHQFSDEEIQIVMVNFDKDVTFLVSEDKVNFMFMPCKEIAEIKNNWFVQDKPTIDLYRTLSLNTNTKLKRVDFHKVDGKFVPYRVKVDSSEYSYLDEFQN